jgi:hypothetical protein
MTLSVLTSSDEDLFAQLVTQLGADDGFSLNRSTTGLSAFLVSSLNSLGGGSTSAKTRSPDNVLADLANQVAGVSTFSAKTTSPSKLLAVICNALP